MILSWLDEAVQAGAREERACDVLGLEARTVQRWRKLGGGDDRRAGPLSKPVNALSDQERSEVLAVANLPEHRDLSPKQIVPKLADEGRYIASESTFYRVLHEADQMTPRGRAKPPQPRPAPQHVAAAPNRIWVWDITYLPTSVRGEFFYLYLMMDLFSRKIVGWQVHPAESMELSSSLLQASVDAEEVDPKQLILHADNGGPMKGSTMLAKMRQLGILPSFSRPRVSDDNAFAEAFFRHLKYAPSWPTKPFASLELAREWVSKFVRWYNEEHRHSGIQFVTPVQRHTGKEAEVLEARARVYAEAKARSPKRWSRRERDWTPAGEVALTAPSRRGPSKGRKGAATVNALTRQLP
ncbi:MAG: IS3 family transposase [Polyangiaceae bacterium]|jgi:transposase InsO family protein|nr:IS3 family transposase [Polyangiaceae bacterium]